MKTSFNRRRFLATAASERLYAALPSDEREKLLGFLNSLVAPQETSRVAQD